jgi:hypothetical protein
MVHLRPGWLVALCAATLAVNVWLPWLTTSANGGGHASAIGGTVGSLDPPTRFGAGQLIVLLSSALLIAGAMVARNLSARLASIAALVISMLIGVLTVWYYHLNVKPPLAAAYGLYIGAAGAVLAVAFSIWALVANLLGSRVMQ